MKLFDIIKNLFKPSRGCPSKHGLKDSLGACSYWDCDACWDMATERITAKKWQCSRCKTIYHSEIGRPIPSPCRMCGGIGFEKIE